MPVRNVLRLWSRRHGRSVVLLVGCCVALPRLSFASDPPLRIERIDIVRVEIFDTTRTEDRHALGSMVNALHVLTREEVIRQELLFRQGEILREDRVEESARNLRALGFLGDARIDVRKSGDSTVVVTVVTQDRWSMDMLPAFKQEGGVQTQRYTLKEDNILGLGKSLSVSYSYQSDRPVPHGTDVAFLDRNVLGTRLRAGLQLRDSWDRTSRSFLLERPYYSDATPWAGGIAAEFGHRRHLFYDEGSPVYEEAGRSQMQRGWFSFSIGSASMLRPVFAYLRARSELRNPRVFDNLDLASVSINVIDRSFVRREYLNSFGRTEDVPIGFTASFTVGKNFLTHGVPAPVYLAQVAVRQSLLLSPDVYFGLGVSAQRYWGGSWSDESAVEALLLHHLKVSRRQTLVAQVAVAAGFGWSGRRQMLLGSSTGLRGYGEGAFSGDRRICYSVEHRVFTDLSLLFFRLGAAAFLDGGTAWFGDSPAGRRHFSNAVGIGLRIENTKVQGSGLVRIDVAMNLDEKRPGHVTISSALPFSAFLDLDSTPSLWSPDGQ